MNQLFKGSRQMIRNAVWAIHDLADKYRPAKTFDVGSWEEIRPPADFPEI